MPLDRKVQAALNAYTIAGQRYTMLWQLLPAQHRPPALQPCKHKNNGFAIDRRTAELLTIIARMEDELQAHVAAEPDRRRSRSDTDHAAVQQPQTAHNEDTFVCTVIECASNKATAGGAPADVSSDTRTTQNDDNSHIHTNDRPIYAPKTSFDAQPAAVEPCMEDHTDRTVREMEGEKESSRSRGQPSATFHKTRYSDSIRSGQEGEHIPAVQQEHQKRGHVAVSIRKQRTPGLSEIEEIEPTVRVGVVCPAPALYMTRLMRALKDQGASPSVIEQIFNSFLDSIMEVV
ncbi:hypothetical protein FN846DRAFT_885728 [Sphaerosporella brunnea]|uniref:Uncharacterized protein n=1 Tax=Sphaerosporella brunnea TaxID=1250544 RepID=A0A5J5FCC8_9PEZI|nr:hypothetical protein FN846DRAFT_885728 [Sphaerosporella brunnea]